MTKIAQPEIKTANKPSANFQELKLKTGFNLNELKNSKSLLEKEQPNEIVIEKYEKKEATSESEVKEAIMQYAKQKQDEGAMQLFVTLSTSNILFENNTINLTLTNATQKEKLQNTKQEFLDEIRKILKDNSVNLEISLSKSESPVKAYKPSDVFKTMSEKNPLLQELKKRLDLEIDY